MLLLGFTSAAHGLKPGSIHATGTIPIIVRTDKLLHHPFSHRLHDFKEASGQLGRTLKVNLIMVKLNRNRHFYNSLSASAYSKVIAGSL